MDKKEVEKYILISLVIFLIAVAFLIVKPFINEILIGIIFGYIFYPVYKKLNLKIKNNYVSSIITLIIILTVIILPLILVTNAIIKESILIYNSDILEKISDFTVKTLGSATAVNRYFEKPVELLAAYANKISSDFILSLPSKILSFFIMLFVIFYTLIHGEFYLKKIKSLLPVKDKEEFIKNIGNTTKSLIYGLFVLAIIELIVTAIGFKIVGVSSPIVWGIVVAILAFIPILGPAIIWVPFAIIEFVNSNPEKAIGIVVIGIILSIIDNFLRPHIIGAKANIHPVIALIGILGGLKLLGMSGIIIGPLLLSLIVTITEGYAKEWS